MNITYDLDDFSCAHRLVKGYQGKCAHLHGHNYAIQVCFTSDTLNDLDMLVDFSDIKSVCNHWVKTHLDHGTLVSTEDPELLAFVTEHKQKHYCFPNGENTTLECLTRLLFHVLSDEIRQATAFGEHIRLAYITAWESKRASVTYPAQ